MFYLHSHLHYELYLKIISNLHEPFSKYNLKAGIFKHHEECISLISIYTLSDLGVLSMIGSLSLANEHCSPPTE